MSKSKICQGQKFGFLVIDKVVFKKGHTTYVECLCRCGNKLTLPYTQLLNKVKNSCGCEEFEKVEQICHQEKMESHERLDITGDRYGKLLVIREVERKNGKRFFECLCDCGNTTIVEQGNLRSNLTTSCGCHRWLTMAGEEKTEKDFNKWKELGITASHRLYKIWRGMLSRCYNKTSSSYKYYGAKGVTVCEEWIKDFLIFYTWACSNGYKEKLTLERRNPFGNYEPSNCEWIPWSEQAKNKRNSKCNKKYKEEYEKNLDKF